MTQNISGISEITNQPLAENLTQDEFNIMFVDNSYINDVFIKQLPDLVKMAVNTAVGVVSFNVLTKFSKSITGFLTDAIKKNRAKITKFLMDGLIKSGNATTFKELAEGWREAKDPVSLIKATLKIGQHALSLGANAVLSACTKLVACISWLNQKTFKADAIEEIYNEIHNLSIYDGKKKSVYCRTKNQFRYQDLTVPEQGKNVTALGKKQSYWVSKKTLEALIQNKELMMNNENKDVLAKHIILPLLEDDACRNCVKDVVIGINKAIDWESIEENKNNDTLSQLAKNIVENLQLHKPKKYKDFFEKLAEKIASEKKNKKSNTVTVKKNEKSKTGDAFVTKKLDAFEQIAKQWADENTVLTKNQCIAVLEFVQSMLTDQMAEGNKADNPIEPKVVNTLA